MKKNETRLPFFGIGKVLPYLRRYKKSLAIMVLGSLAGSCVDVGVPLFQRYALNHFVALGTLDTLPVFIALYFGVIVASALMNYAAAYQGMAICATPPSSTCRLSPSPTSTATAWATSTRAS